MQFLMRTNTEDWKTLTKVRARSDKGTGAAKVVELNIYVTLKSSRQSAVLSR